MHQASAFAGIGNLVDIDLHDPKPYVQTVCYIYLLTYCC